MPKLNRDGTIKVTEDDIEDMTVLAFEYRGWLVLRTHLKSQYRPIHPGMSDLIAIKNGYHVFIECKRPGYKVKLSPAKQSKTEAAQQEFCRQVVKAGGRYVLITSEDELYADLGILDTMASLKR
jgi:Holliday junction resolvase